MKCRPVISRCSELLSTISNMADFDVTFVTAVCLQYIVIVASSILMSRNRRRRRQIVDADAQCK